MKVALSALKGTGPKRDHGDIESLKQSIREVGLICPIAITEDYTLLAGRRRFQALSELGWADVECHVIPVNGDSLRAFKVALDENLKHKPLTDPEVALAIREYDELKRKLEGDKPRGNPNLAHCAELGGWTQEKTAIDLGISPPAVRKAIKIATAIEEYPDLANQISGQAILTEYKRRTFEPVSPPTGEYRTIVIDPPWPIAKIQREVRPNQLEIDYPIMTVEEIRALPIADLSFDDGCHVYLWTTHKFMPIAFELFQSWGVKYECLLTWVKNVGFTPFSWMYSTEHCLFGRIGNLPLEQLGKRVDFAAPVTKHSEKPSAFYELVEDVSPTPRIDMFARKERQGWDTWGNEVQ